MPAYAKVSVVSALFHPSDLAFVRLWSAAAPGFGGWKIDPASVADRVQVIPPGSRRAVFVITREPRDVRLAWLADDGSSDEEAGRYGNLRLAVQALCPLHDDRLEKIHQQMERDFPRPSRTEATRRSLPDSSPPG